MDLIQRTSSTEQMTGRVNSGIIGICQIPTRNAVLIYLLEGLHDLTYRFLPMPHKDIMEKENPDLKLCRFELPQNCQRELAVSTALLHIVGSAQKRGVPAIGQGRHW